MTSTTPQPAERGMRDDFEAWAKSRNLDPDTMDGAYWLGWRAAREAVVPLSGEQCHAIYRQVSAEVNRLEGDGKYTFAGWFPVAVKLIEAAHGIKEHKA